MSHYGLSREFESHPVKSQFVRLSSSRSRKFKALGNTEKEQEPQFESKAGKT